mmetsp:Transcript_1674/g.3574  ORF Transcript_1674/g.3574 Transcript_1674/m.3574 type:complete len:301 (+) Transcript_1674:644-1546(+)
MRFVCFLSLRLNPTKQTKPIYNSIRSPASLPVSRTGSPTPPPPPTATFAVSTATAAPGAAPASTFFGFFPLFLPSGHPRPFFLFTPPSSSFTTPSPAAVVAAPTAFVFTAPTAPLLTDACLAIVLLLSSLPSASTSATFSMQPGHSFSNFARRSRASSLSTTESACCTSPTSHPRTTAFISTNSVSHTENARVLRRCIHTHDGPNTCANRLLTVIISSPTTACSDELCFSYSFIHSHGSGLRECEFLSLLLLSLLLLQMVTLLPFCAHRKHSTCSAASDRKMRSAIRGGFQVEVRARLSK